ncbi:MAG: carboxypeptidase regulatory-like domain-containing protein [Vicinamibacteria bacterium]|nr:carboxypeptidase regulatory-like domain-containing protein [Vicinamibacteria bacterium]
MLATSLLLAALAAAPLFDVSITVVDPSGARIPGATVEVDPGSAQVLSAVTGPRGEAVVPGVESGEHRFRVTIQGFEPWEKKVRVRGGQGRVEAKLKLARVL